MPKLVKIVSIFVALAICSLALLGFAKPAAPAPPGFTDFDFRGDYAFSAHTDGSGDHLATAGLIGRFTADGHGHLTNGIMTLAGGGSHDTHHESITCNYVVGSNGAGSMACVSIQLDGEDVGTRSEGKADFVLADAGREFYSVNTNMGEVIGLVSIGKRQ